MPPKKQMKTSWLHNRNSFIALCLIGFCLILLKAWVAEDAFISARVIDNFVNGFGLRWNIDERVQVYTHPLWLLIHIPFYAVIHDFFHITIFISILFSVLAIALPLMGRALDYRKISLFFILPLLLSRAFMDYTTSGMETPLVFLLISLFFIEIRKANKGNIYSLILIASFAAVNRYDSILLFLPFIAYKLINNSDSFKYKKLFLSALPILLWVAFSLFYYGFIFPNTKYAKLDTGVPMLEYMLQGGLAYLKNFAMNDSASLFIIITALYISYKNWRRLGGVAWLAPGIVLYIIYIFYIGGDFMSGRMFAPLVFASVLVINHYAEMADKKISSVFPIITIITFILSLVYVMYPPNVFSKPFAMENFLEKETLIQDSRAWGWQTNHLLSLKILNRGLSVEDNIFAQKGLRLNKEAEECGKPGCYVTQDFAVGMLGFYAGPNVIIIDNFAIGDALLARTPLLKGAKWWPGHFMRIPPNGYVNARKTWSLEKMDENRALYYEKLQLITSGELFDINRIKTIIEFNVGKYDHLIKQ